MPTREKLVPGHKVCPVNVNVPTILVEPFDEGGKKEVFVQWSGESDFADLEGMQFRFPVPLAPEDTKWMSHPELFKVIFFGQIKDYPDKKALPAVVKMVGKGDPEVWILWVTSNHYTLKYPSGIGPACFMIPMSVVLGDYFGIINPKLYSDLTVLERERQGVEEVAR